MKITIWLNKQWSHTYSPVWCRSMLYRHQTSHVVSQISGWRHMRMFQKGTSQRNPTRLDLCMCTVWSMCENLSFLKLRLKANMTEWIKRKWKRFPTWWMSSIKVQATIFCSKGITQQHVCIHIHHIRITYPMHSDMRKIPADLTNHILSLLLM